MKVLLDERQRACIRKLKSTGNINEIRQGVEYDVETIIIQDDDMLYELKGIIGEFNSQLFKHKQTYFAQKNGSSFPNIGEPLKDFFVYKNNEWEKIEKTHYYVEDISVISDRTMVIETRDTIYILKMM